MPFIAGVTFLKNCQPLVFVAGFRHELLFADLAVTVRVQDRTQGVLLRLRLIVRRGRAPGRQECS
jgi:hypothetical protein